MPLSEEAAAPTRSTSSRSRTRTRELVTAALIAGLMAGTAWISIPFGPVPFTLQTVFVLLAALLLSPGWAAASMGTYLLLGGVGLPVFAGAQGGLGALLGPTGGFLIGFVPAAYLGSLAFGVMRRSGSQWIVSSITAAVIAEAVVFAVGLPWLMISTKMGLVPAMAVAVVPFLFPDVMKSVLAIAIAGAVRKAQGTL